MSAHNGLLQTPDNSERIVPRIVLSHQQYFHYANLTVTCGGFFNNMTKWRVGRYKCGTSGSKEFSEENLLQVKAVVLECPDEPVKEGESVTLSCRDKMAASNVTYLFYKDDKERAGSSTGELTLMEVSKTDEGVYKCKSSELRESEAQWLAVAVVDSQRTMSLYSQISNNNFDAQDINEKQSP
uniref:Ig-like domain-containing protein n=1 Tax=Knipowitschia caucasica TaxID=637954 RepID=A0AAV2KM21_KNICA